MEDAQAPETVKSVPCLFVHLTSWVGEFGWAGTNAGMTSTEVD